jgi:hypothetical protein
MEFLKHHPVADDVLDIVGHHRNRKGDELRAEARVAHRGERSLRRRNRRCGVFGLDVQGSTLRGAGGRRLRNPVKYRWYRTNISSRQPAILRGAHARLLCL